MSFLLDTNIVSETRKRRPAPQVIRFIDALGDTTTYLSVLSLGEMRKGVARKQAVDPAMAAEFLFWLEDIEQEFTGRLLPVTAEIAHRWGVLSSDRSRPIVDTLIAATALEHDLTVVTRNEADYRDLGVMVLNPWL